MNHPRIDTNHIRRTVMTNRRLVIQLCEEIDRLRAERDDHLYEEPGVRNGAWPAGDADA